MASTSPHALAWVEEILDRNIAAHKADPDGDLEQFRRIGYLSDAYMQYVGAMRDGQADVAKQHLAEVERLAAPLR